MQKTAQDDLDDAFDALIREFDEATRGLFTPVKRDFVDFPPAYRVAKIIPFPTRETLQ